MTQVVHRNWSTYNAAQTNEKLLALRIINDAVDSLCVPHVYRGNGRPAFGMDDMLKCACVKVFNCFSSRRTMAELRLAYALEYISHIPHFNSISNYMRSEEMTPWLHRLYKTLAVPLAVLETSFSADATGFSTLTKKHWIDCRLDIRAARDFKKLHLVSGNLTNVVTAARVTRGPAGDSPYFEGMLRDTSESFRIREVCADAAYLSYGNCRVAEELGARPFIDLRANTSLDFGKMGKYENRRNYAWVRMINMWQTNREEFLRHYHQRSRVESVFSAMKRKFLPYIRSKGETAQYNEMLAKVVCHNASILCSAMFEPEVSAHFGKYI